MNERVLAEISGFEPDSVLCYLLFNCIVTPSGGWAYLNSMGPSYALLNRGLCRVNPGLRTGVALILSDFFPHFPL
jgi:hypothetical protein